jgi:hypothetical protein
MDEGLNPKVKVKGSNLCHQKEWGDFFVCVNLICWVYILNVNCWNLPKIEKMLQVLFLHLDPYKH